MAGDWIKMRTDLYRDPKVCVIADILLREDGDLANSVSQSKQRDMAVTRNVMRNATVGSLVTVWGVMRLRGKRDGDDLVCRHCTVSVLDDLADMPGFGEALREVEWVVESEEGVVFPNFFQEYNVDPSEDTKVKNAERQRRYREKQKEKSNVTRNVTVTSQRYTREEKRREEKKDLKENSPEPPAVAAAPDASPVLMTIPTNRFNTGGELFTVTESMAAEWSETYPAVNVPEQLKIMLGWCRSNPTKRKTLRGMPKFIEAWLAREQNKGGNASPNQPGYSGQAQGVGFIEKHVDPAWRQGL